MARLAGSKQCQDTLIRSSGLQVQGHCLVLGSHLSRQQCSSTCMPVGLAQLLRLHCSPKAPFCVLRSTSRQGPGNLRMLLLLLSTGLHQGVRWSIHGCGLCPAWT
jgi:hypothetical protein